MNNIRRKELKSILERIEELESLKAEIQEQLESVLDEEQEAFDNMPESLQESDRGETMSEGIDSMQDVLDGLDEIDTDSWTEILAEL